MRRFDHQKTLAAAAAFAALLVAGGCAGTGGEEVRRAEMEAAAAMEAGDYSVAIEALSRANDLAKDDPGVFYQLGRAYLALGESQAADPQMGDNPGLMFEDAAGYFRRAIDLDPGHPEARLMLARALYMNNELEGAAEAAQVHLQHAPADAGALSLLGEINMARFRQGSEIEAAAALGAAVSSLQKAVALDPGREAAHAALGDACLYMGQNGAARAAYEAGIRACPESNTLHARLFGLKGAEDGVRPDEGVAFYAGLLAERKDWVPEAAGKLWWFRGEWHGAEGLDLYAAEDFEAAAEQFSLHLDCLRESTAVCGDYAEDARTTGAFVRLNRGWCRLQRKLFREAEEDVFACLDLFPEDDKTVQAVDALGFAIYENEGSDAALNFFRRLTAAYGGRHQWWNDFGFFSLETNMQRGAPPEDYAETLEIYRRALELKPDYPRYLNDKAMVIDYYIDQAGERRAEVEEMYRQAWRLGREAYESPFTSEAEKAVMFSAYTDAMVNLARLYFIQDRRDEFEAVMADLEEAAPDRPETRLLRQGIIPDKSGGAAGGAEEEEGAQQDEG